MEIMREDIAVKGRMGAWKMINFDFVSKFKVILIFEIEFRIERDDITNYAQRMEFINFI